MYVMFVKEVSRMGQMSSHDLRAVRIEVAINVCLRFPSLYNKIYGKSKAPITDYESGAADILVGLCKLEPCVKYILDFYYKRELR